MSAHVCPVVRLGKPAQIQGADKIELFEIQGSGPVIQAKGQFKEGDLACFIPPETMVDTGLAAFEFLKKSARKSDGWAKIKPIRLRGQLSVGILVSAMGAPVDSNLADKYNVKKIEDLETQSFEKTKTEPGFWRRLWSRITFKGAPERGLWPGIPVYDINQLYKMRSGLFSPDELMVVTEKLHGTNARFTIGKDGKLWVGSRTMWRLHDGKNVYSRAATQSGVEAKLRRLSEPLVLWGEIVGPGIQKGFSYSLPDGEQKFYAFDIYNAGLRRFLDPCETKDICHWLGIDYVPIVAIDSWDTIQPLITRMATDEDAFRGFSWRTIKKTHPREGVVVRPWRVVREGAALDGSRCLLAGKVINPLYLEFREKPGMDEQVIL